MSRKWMLILILMVIVVGGLGVVGYYWYENTHFVKTEDAHVDGDQYRVIPQISAEIVHQDVQEGDTVTQNEAVAEQDTANLDPSLIDKAVLRAPVTGTLVKWYYKEHEMATPGQAVALIMDMNNLYVTANIEETSIDKIRLGQPVDITVDAMGGEVLQGIVKEIGKASNSTFSLLPAVNTSGNFNKVTQRIPVKIAIVNKPANVQLIPGTNVEVRIHIR